VRQLEDVNSKLHFLVKYGTTTDPSGRKRSKARPCKSWKKKGSRKDTIYYCILCGLGCSFCNDPSRDYFKDHVMSIARQTRSSGLVVRVLEVFFRVAGSFLAALETKQPIFL